MYTCSASMHVKHVQEHKTLATPRRIQNPLLNSSRKLGRDEKGLSWCLEHLQKDNNRKALIQATVQPAPPYYAALAFKREKKCPPSKGTLQLPGRTSSLLRRSSSTCKKEKHEFLFLVDNWTYRKSTLTAQSGIHSRREIHSLSYICSQNEMDDRCRREAAYTQQC